MHYLHLVLVNADSLEEACSVAEESIPQNSTYDYYEICGSVSKDTGEIYSTGEGRFCPKERLDEESNSLNFIKDAGDKKAVILNRMEEMLVSWKKREDSEENITKMKEAFNKLIKGGEAKSFDLYLLKDFVAHHYEVVCDKESSSLWESSFNSFKFSDCGITKLYSSTSNLYCVFVDFHS
jgi:hypothetical protein